MANQQIDIRISGDPSGAVKAFDQVQKSAGKMATVIPKSTGAVTAFNQVLREVPAFAFNAQTGILAVSNNLPILFDQFDKTKNGGIGFVAQLKNIGASLFTLPSILTIGVSALTLFADKIFDSGKKANEASDRIRDFIKNSRSIATIQDEAISSVKGQAAELSALIKVVADSNRADKERLNALQRIKDINPELTKGITLQASGIKTLTERVEEYTKALIAEAVVKEFSQEAGKAARNEAEAARVVENAKQRVRNAEKDLASAKLFGISASKAVSGVSSDEKNAETALAKAKESLSEANNLLFDAGVKRLELENLLNDAVDKAVKLSSTRTKTTKDEKTELEKLVEAIKNRISALEKLEEIQGRLNKLQREEKAGLQIELLNLTGLKEGFKPEEIQDQIKRILGGIELKPTPIKIPIQAILEGESEITKKFNQKAVAKSINIPKVKLNFLGLEFDKNKTKEDIEKEVEDISKVISSSIRSSIIGAADAVGEAFAGLINGDSIAKSLSRVGESLFKIIGSALQQIGAQIIPVAVLAEKLKKALANLIANPAAAIAVGAGLIATGALLKNLKFNIPAFAEGGVVTGPTLGLVGEAGKEAIIPLDRIGEVLGSIGGAQTVFVTGSISGQQINLVSHRRDVTEGKLF